MGPTNVALVKLFRADRALREAQERLEAATKNVRVQERRVTDLAERIKLAHTRLREQQSSGGQLELDVKTREARIEKLRAQQAITRNNKEYQTFLIEINTEKVDRGKAEDELIKVMEAIEKGQAEIKDLTTQHDAEQAKFTALKNDIGQTVIRLQAQVDELRPACSMRLVPDVYNRLHSRDDMVCCPSCVRILYIPEELPPEVAINSRGKSEAREPRVTTSGAAPRARRAKGAEKLDPTERRAKGRFGRVLDAAQGESVKIALDAGEKPVECDVTIDGRPQGVYKGRSAEHLHRIVSLRIEEAGLKGAVEVHEKPQPPEESPAEASASASDTPEVVAAQPADEQGMAQQGIGQAGDALLGHALFVGGLRRNDFG